MEQDAAWKRLFGRPVVVRHLLRGFAPEVAELLDLDTLKPLPASWVAPDGEQHRGDVAWRVWHADGSGRSLVLLIENQSTVHQNMAVRVLRYELFAYDALRRQGVLDPDGEQRLLSVVIYRGWRPGTRRVPRRAWRWRGAARQCGRYGPTCFLTRGAARKTISPGEHRGRGIVAVRRILADGRCDAVAMSARAWSSRGGPESAEVVVDWLGMLWPRTPTPHRWPRGGARC